MTGDGLTGGYPSSVGGSVSYSSHLGAGPLIWTQHIPVGPF